MKKLSVVVMAMFFCMIASTTYAIDAKRLEKIKITEQNNNKDLFAGTVKVADLGKKRITEVVPPKTPKTVPVLSKSVLSSGQVVIAMPMEGEWFRLGPQYCGTKTIYHFVLQICKRDFTKSVLADNHLTFEKAKRLGVGHKVFVRHIYLKDEYKFGLEKDRKSQGRLDDLRQQLSSQLQEMNDLRQALKNAGKGTVSLRGELKKTRRLLTEKIKEVSLRDSRIKELKETNSDLEKQVAEKSAVAIKAQELFIQLAGETVNSENGENATAAAKKLLDEQGSDTLLARINDLKQQLAEKSDALAAAKQKADELKGEKEVLSAKHGLLTTEHADLKEMFKQQMATFNTLGQKIETGFDRLEKEKVELKAQIEQLKVDLETAQKQLKECRKIPVDLLSGNGTKTN